MVGQLGRWACEALTKQPTGRIGGRPAEASRKYFRGVIGRCPSLSGSQALFGWQHPFSGTTPVPVAGGEVLPRGLNMGMAAVQYSLPTGQRLLEQRERLGGAARVLVGLGQVLP